jgi:Cu/Ag efflux pump CusA
MWIKAGVSALIIFLLAQSIAALMWGARMSERQEMLIEDVKEIKVELRTQGKAQTRALEDKFRRLETMIDVKTKDRYHAEAAKKDFEIRDMQIADLGERLESSKKHYRLLELLVHEKLGALPK